MFEDIVEYMRSLKVYALGKGILTVAVMSATALSAAFLGASAIWPAALIASVGGVALTAVSRLHHQRAYENSMVDLYRNNIAQQLHIAPEDVSRSDLREAAKENMVIASALERQRKKTVLTISTAAVAGSVSMLALGMFDALNLMRGVAEASFRGLASLVGVGTVSAASSLVLHNGMDAAIGYSAGIEPASANDMIMKMDRSIKRGKPVAREEVYSILAASDRAVATRISTAYGKSYQNMSRGEQSNVLHEFGLAESMDQLAQLISKHEMDASQLAYIQVKLPADSLPRTTPQESSFVQRLGLAPKQEQKHTEQLAAQRQHPPTAELSAAR